MRHVRLDNVLLARGPQAHAGRRRQAAGHGALGRSALFRGRAAGPKGAGADGQPRPGRPDVSHGVSDHGDERPGLVRRPVGRAARIARQRRGHRSCAAAAVGQAFSPASTPGGKTIAAAGGLAKASLGPLDECGVWSVVDNAVRNDVSRPRRVTARGVCLLRSSSSPATWRTEPRATCACRKRCSKRQPPTALAGGWFTRPIWFYLVRPGLAAGGGGMVPLSAAVDQLMNGSSLSPRTDAPRAADLPRGAAGAALLLLPQPGRFSALAAGRLAGRSHRDRRAAGPGAGGPDAAAADDASSSSSSPSIEARASAKNRRKPPTSSSTRPWPTPAATSSPSCRLRRSRASCRRRSRPPERRESVSQPDRGRTTTPTTADDRRPRHEHRSGARSGRRVAAAGLRAAASSSSATATRRPATR